MSMSKFASSADYWKAEAERNKQDAERYRWLRNQHWYDSDLCVVLYPKNSVKLGSVCPCSVYLDSAIDVAMEKETDEH